MTGLPGPERSLTIYSALWIQYTNVTEEWTDGSTDTGRQQRLRLRIATRTFKKSIRLRLDVERQSNGVGMAAAAVASEWHPRGDFGRDKSINRPDTLCKSINQSARDHHFPSIGEQLHMCKNYWRQVGNFCRYPKVGHVGTRDAAVAWHMKLRGGGSRLPFN